MDREEQLESGNGNRYIVISPARNEEKYVETTLKSVIGQTIKPARWIVVDDNSTDRTPSILTEYAATVDWITLLNTRRQGGNHLGVAEIKAFNAGFAWLGPADFDFVVKLDCDVELAPAYFEQLMAKFQADDRLGIASGVYWENRDGAWSPVKMPAYHASGASKMMRRACFEDVQGFICSRGWDTVDEIRASMKGWKTAHFEDLPFRHLKQEGSAAGPLHTNLMHGEIYYLTGGGAFFFLFKLLDRLVHARPLLLAPLAMLVGFLKPWVTGKSRSVTRAEARFYRQMLNCRLRRSLAGLIGRSKTTGAMEGAN